MMNPVLPFITDNPDDIKLLVKKAYDHILDKEIK